MPKRCATPAEFLAVAPDFLSVGSKSVGSITLATQPLIGDFVVLSTQYGVPLVEELYEAGTDFAIGATVEDTALNLAAAIDGRALASATSSGSLITIVSKATGPIGVLVMVTSDPLVFVLSGPTLVGGLSELEFALHCACSMINLECWGEKAECAHIYLTAHILAIVSGAGGGESGPIERKKIDKIEIQYAASSSTSESDFGSTKWGRLYLAMRKTLFIAPLPGRRFLVSARGWSWPCN